MRHDIVDYLQKIWTFMFINRVDCSTAISALEIEKKKKDKIQVSWIITNCGFSFSLYSLFACFNGIFIMSLSFFASIALTHAQRYSRINKHRYAKRTRKKDYPFTFKVHNISLLVENCTVCISRVKGWNQ